MEVFDMHCHLDFAANASLLADELGKRGVGALSVTVTPHAYAQAAETLSSSGNVCVALGLHPWWVADDSDLEAFEGLAPHAASVGEVGLDLGPRHRGTAVAQMEALDRVAAACARHGGKVVSLHAVRAADKVLDVLERRDCLAGNAAIFHWFSGTSDELQRAIRAGCYFSVGARMLATKRGRAYAQAIPRARLLLETDEPSSPENAASAATAGVGQGEEVLPPVLLESAMNFTSADRAQAMESHLRGTLKLLAQARGEDANELAPCIAATSSELMGFSRIR